MGSEPKLELQKGGYARLREGTVIGSIIDWATYQGSMDGKVRPVVQ
jgi:hypothetical protein